MACELHDPSQHMNQFNGSQQMASENLLSLVLDHKVPQNLVAYYSAEPSQETNKELDFNVNEPEKCPDNHDEIYSLLFAPVITDRQSIPIGNVLDPIILSEQRHSSPSQNWDANKMQGYILIVKMEFTVSNVKVFEGELITPWHELFGLDNLGLKST